MNNFTRILKEETLSVSETLADFSKDNFPYDKWFVHDDVYFYPSKYLDEDTLEGVFGDIQDDELEIGVGDIEVKHFAEWATIKKSDIPKEILEAMMDEFKDLIKDEDKDE